jgi:sulfate/thiosulfate-binding protein
MRSIARFLIATVGSGLLVASAGAQTTLLNVSYDPTRELYKDINAAFARQWKAQSGQDVEIKQSHGGSAKQARSVIDGLEADVVTLGVATDIDALHDHGDLVPENWASRLPDDSTPYTSTVVFLVRKGNPKQIHDWSDLVKPGVSIVAPNPKTSAGGRWAYLAAYGFAYLHGNKDQAQARQFIGAFYHNVAVLDSGARGSTTSFAKRNIGDVLPAWENEAWLALDEFGKDQFEIVYPPESILAEPPVSIVDKFADKHGTREVAEAYLKFLYTPEAQEIEAKHHYRPRNEEVIRAHAKDFPQIKLYKLGDFAGDWKTAQKTHFEDGGVFDQIYQPK